MFDWREFLYSLNWREGWYGLLIGLLIIGCGLLLGWVTTLLFPALGPTFWAWVMG